MFKGCMPAGCWTCLSSSGLGVSTTHLPL